MKKYFQWFSLIPLTILTMVFLAEEEMADHAKKQCIGLLMSFIIFAFLYFSLLHLKIDRFIAVGIAITLWIVMFFVKRKFLI